MNDRRHKFTEDSKEEPPFSRIFVVCGKQHKEEDLREAFDRFGIIENLHMPQDRQTGESKGVAYIKYTKTSSAAAAIESMHLKTIANSSKPVKVMIANQKNEGNVNISDNKCTRLFIMVPKGATDEELLEHFSKFGQVQALHVQKKKNKFAYVIYKSFLMAATAYENCDTMFKAMFAAPRDELKRSRDHYESQSVWPFQNNIMLTDGVYNSNIRSNSSTNEQSEGYKKISVTVTPQLAERYITSLFNVIPCMEKIDYSVDKQNQTSTSVITYGEHKYAACAVDRLNKFEFPSGEIVTVKPDTNIIARAATDLTNMVQSLKNAMDTGSSANELVHLADAIAQASSLIKEATTSIAESPSQDLAFCNVKLPPIQPLADSHATVAKRCFTVWKPQAPPIPALRDVFCRFGNFIDVVVYPNKTYGFVKYAAASSADEARNTLNGATVCGVRIKVLEADEKQGKDESLIDKKRMKIVERTEK